MPRRSERAARIPLLGAATLAAVVQVGCASTQPVPAAWQSIPAAAPIRNVQLDGEGKVTTAMVPLRPASIRIDGNRIVRGDTPLTPAFAAIDSFDVSESRGEVAFSAKRTNDFDIGLVSTDGSPISWVPNDPADEVKVQWAPRGNKISYVVRSKSGDLIRTVHIPTAAQLVVDFGAAKIETLGWDPKGERFAVVYSTPDASDRIEVLKYGGEDRKLVAPPAVRLDAEVSTFGPNAISLRPRDVAYNEKLPLVVWLDDEPFAWSDARAALLRGARVACIVTRALDDAVWKSVESAWIDRGRTFVVARRPVAVTGATLIVADAALAPGRYRRAGTTVAVSPDVVQSFASHFIAEELKRTGPPNGSSR